MTGYTLDRIPFTKEEIQTWMPQACRLFQYTYLDFDSSAKFRWKISDAYKNILKPRLYVGKGLEVSLNIYHFFFFGGKVLCFSLLGNYPEVIKC